MSETIFERLLESYSGMRKRTWNPSLVGEAANPLLHWKRRFGVPKGVDPLTHKSNLETARSNIKALASGGEAKVDHATAAENVRQAAYGTAVLSTKHPPGPATTIYVQANNKDVDQFRIDKAQIVLAAIDELLRGIGESEAEKSPVEKAGDKAVRGSEEGVPEVQEERVALSDTERETAIGVIEKLLGILPNVASKIIAKLENTINTPAKNTKLGKFFEFMELENPTLTSESKKQLKSLMSHLFNIANKANTPEALSPAEKAALKVITIRRNGDVYFGRPGEAVPGYEDLQEQAAFGDSNYGFHLGKAMNQFGPLLGEARIVTDSDGNESIRVENPGTMSDSEFDKLPKAFPSSKAGGSGNNDAVGKVTEYFWELGMAISTGDKGAIAEAREKVKKGLKKLGGLPEDLEVLETPITDENYDILNDVVSQMQEAGGVTQFVKNLVRNIGRSVESYQKALNIQPGDVVKVAAPSQSSKMGERPDVIAFIRPEAKINKKALTLEGRKVTLHVVTPKDLDIIKKYGEDVVGTTMLNTSIKQKKEEGGTTRMGSGAYRNMVEPPTGEYDKLQKSALDRAEKEGLMTPEQREDCMQALEADRKHHEVISKKIRALSPKNKKDVVDFLNKTVLAGGTSIEGMEKYKEEADSIAKGLQSDDKEVRRLAEIRLVQMARMRRTRGGTTGRGARMARAHAFNDAVLSFASREEEPIYIDSPQSLKTTTNHQVMSVLANALFKEEGDVDVNPARTTVKNKDGSPVFGLRRVARTDKNPGYEFEMFKKGEDAATKTIPR